MKEGQDSLLSIAIPLFNEESNCLLGINDIIEQLDRSEHNYELILVNNGSHDTTGDIIDDIQRKNTNNIKTVHIVDNLGYGGGILAGLEVAEGSYVGWTSSDGEIDGKDLTTLYGNMIETGSDFGKTIRVKRSDGIRRKIFTFCYSVVILVTFQRYIRDVNGYPKIIARDLYNTLSLHSSNWFLDTEVMLKIPRKGIKQYFLPVTYKSRTAGESHVRFHHSIEFLIEVLKVRLKGF